MENVALLSGLITLVCLIVALLTFRYLLRFWDYITGVNFKQDVTPLLKREPLAMAIYRAAVLIALAMIVSAVLS
jgi:hypothetical protein